SRFKRARCGASQAPGQARGREVKVDRTVYATLRHRFHDDSAKPAPLRGRYRGPLTLDPAHGDGVVADPPGDADTTPSRRERPVLSSVGGKLVEREPDGLRGSCLEAQLGAMDSDTRTNEVGEQRELGVNQVLGLDPVPFVADQQVLIC